MKDVSAVGGKNASLGEMIKNLVPRGIRIPSGFATTAEAYFYFLRSNNLDKKIASILKNINISNLKELTQKGRKVRELILNTPLPEDLEKDILWAYQELSAEYKSKAVDVAVRSSATAEDLPGASFAGQQETYLNIKGKEKLIESVKKCFASLFTDRAIVYREEKGFSHDKIALSVGIQKMVRADLGASGVIFSCDTESGFGDVILINASYGLGENIVQGKVEPDQYYVFETILRKVIKEGGDLKPIIEKKMGSKLIKMVYSQNPLKPTINVATSEKERRSFVLLDEEILTLAKWAILIEDHYGQSMDIEWAKDGKEKNLYIVQARPETIHSKKELKILEEYVLKDFSSKKARILARGLSVGRKIGVGRAHKIMNVKEISKFKKGEVLITKATDPNWVPAMKLAAAIVTDLGGRTCHAAIVGRELGVPVIVGTDNATKVIKSGVSITVDCSGGEEGRVYEGILPFEVKKIDISSIPTTKTKILMNVGEPSNAFNLSFIPNDGVGLAREEFIIANEIKIHPMALVSYRQLPSGVKRKIDELTLGYSNKMIFFVDKLAEGIGKIGAAFYPKPVIVRFSDFKTNEYRSLIGGELFEGLEENPMIGFRGASRYYNEKFKKAFILECQAIKKVREEFGLENVQVMIPFCRTVEEGKKVLELLKENGLSQESGLKIYVMCEIPSNVILADKFLDIFDGFSIGSNDLTQLVLGLDRDNAQINQVGNEKDEAVKILIKEVVDACRRRNKYVGICGQAPSDFPEFAQFLVEIGIESISLNPDAVLKTRILIAETEKRLEQINKSESQHEV